MGAHVLIVHATTIKARSPEIKAHNSGWTERINYYVFIQMWLFGAGEHALTFRNLCAKAGCIGLTCCTSHPPIPEPILTPFDNNIHLHI